jgi:IclR family KDG regulon transcriptional repressor
VHAIQQVDNGRYTLDYKMQFYAKSSSNHHDLVKAARKTMKTLVSLTGETVNIGICQSEQVLVLAIEIGGYYLLQAQLLPISPLYCSSMGKLFLSQFSDIQLQNYFVN